MSSNIDRTKIFILYYLYDNQELMRRVSFTMLVKRYFKNAAKFGRGYCHKKYHSQISLSLEGADTLGLFYLKNKHVHQNQIFALERLLDVYSVKTQHYLVHIHK